MMFRLLTQLPDNTTPFPRATSPCRVVLPASRRVLSSA